MTYEEFKSCGGFQALKRLYFDVSFLKTVDGKRIFCRNAIFDNSDFQDMVRIFGAKNIDIAYKEIQSLHAKQKRILDKVQTILLTNRKHWFVTLTLSDEYVNKSKRYLRDHICSAFYGLDFIFNEDYGDRTGRLHFHGVLAADESVEELKLRWPYGFSDFSYIDGFRDKQISLYVYKIRNHAMKDSTHNSRIITNRVKKTCV